MTKTQSEDLDAVGTVVDALRELNRKNRNGLFGGHVRTQKTPPHEICFSAEETQRDSRRCSMKKVRPVVARNPRELAKVLGLAPADGMEIECRSDLNDKSIEVVAKKRLTHSDVARPANT